MTSIAGTNGMNRGNPMRIAVWGSAIGLWLLPLIARLFTTEMNWDTGDFVLWAVMLGTAAGLYELATRMSSDRSYRLGFALAVLTGFLITWSNLAVGIVGNENNAVNLIFFAILAIGLVGAVISRFRAAGMARTVTIVATAQAATVLLALYADGPRVAMILAVFTTMWFASAELFRRAARIGV